MTTITEDYEKLAEEYQSSRKDEKWSIHDTKLLADFARWIEESNGGSVDNAPLRAVRVELQCTQDRLRVVSLKSGRRRRELRRLFKAHERLNNLFYRKGILRQSYHLLQDLETGKVLSTDHVKRVCESLKVAIGDPD